MQVSANRFDNLLVSATLFYSCRIACLLHKLRLGVYSYYIIFSYTFIFQSYSDDIEQLPDALAAMISLLPELLKESRAENIGITHVFSCINICRVPRMLFEHEADMCDRYSCIFYLIPTQFALKTLLKHKLSIFLHWISLNKMASAVFFQTSLRQNRTQRFREQKHRRNDQSGPQCVPYK